MRNQLVKLAQYSLPFLMLSSCSVFDPVQPVQIQRYQFNNEFLADASRIDGNCSRSKYPFSLQLSRNKASSPYDSFKMFYSLNSYTINNYNYSQWASLPQTTLNELVEHQVTKSCLYKDVINNSFITNAKYRLINQIIQLKLDLTNLNNPTARLIVYAQLIDIKNNQALKHKIFVEETNVTASPQGLAQGTATNTKKFLADLISWISN